MDERKKLKIPPPPPGTKRFRIGGGLKVSQRCPCGKIRFSTYDKAMGSAYNVIPGDVKRVYWCPESGSFHFTGSPKMSRKQRRVEFQEFNDELQELQEDGNED